MSAGATVSDELADSLLDLACRLAREAGDLAAEGRRRGVPENDTKSTATDMVTEWDRASEQVIVAGLRAARPDDSLIGEEGSTAQGTSGIGWLVDPIDGTTNFLYDLPGWAVSIAAMDAEGALAGAVYVPAHDELFTAIRGRGAACNGRPIRCGTLADPATALLATGFSYDPARRERHTRRLAHVLPEVRDIRRFGAASVDLCHAAMGRVDAYVEEWLGPWDLAAGELIAREAGCRTGDLEGGPARPQQVLVANPALFEPLAELLRAAWATA
ncbi:MAG: inositol monophosphatase family protein [Acidimicrobiales bacterium]